MKFIQKMVSAVLRFFARITVSFGSIFNKGEPSANPAGRGTGNEARPRKRLVDGVDADRFTRLCVILVIGFVSLIGAVLILASLHSGSHEIPVEDQEEAAGRTVGSLAGAALVVIVEKRGIGVVVASGTVDVAFRQES